MITMSFTLSVLPEDIMESFNRLNISSNHFSGDDDDSSFEVVSLSGDVQISEWTEKLHHDGKRQFIKRRESEDGGLPFSAEFYLNGETWKLSGDDCLLMTRKRYIAIVSVKDGIDMGGVSDFQEAKRILLKHLKVEKVLLDEDLEEWNKAKSDLQTVLEKLTGETGGTVHHRREVRHLRSLLKEYESSLNTPFKRDLMACTTLSSKTKMVLDNYVTTTMKLVHRNEILCLWNELSPSLSDEFIEDAIQRALTIHRTRLEAVWPPAIQDQLTTLSDDHLLYVSTKDMELLNQLTDICQIMFEPILQMIFARFQGRIVNEQVFELNPMANQIFLQVCKSLYEVADELGRRTNQPTVTYSAVPGFEALDAEDTCETNRYLRKQVRMLVDLANHFEPGRPSRKSRFPYQLNIVGMSDTVRIWFCLVDYCMKDHLPDFTTRMEQLSHFYKSCLSFGALSELSGEKLECVRKKAHEAIRSFFLDESRHSPLETSP